VVIDFRRGGSEKPRSTMATIDIRRSHHLSKEAAREKAEDLARSMQERLGIEWRWDGDRIKFDAPSGAAKGATGQVEVGADEVRVQIDLPFLMRPMKGMVESKVREKLEKALG
jgi:putative polyhydroxyalkanoate system protein